MAASVEVRHARLLKPFSTRRLRDALYHVQADADAIRHEVERLLREPPTTPEPWTESLFRLADLLASLVERCEEAMPKVDRLAEEAPADFRRAVTAMEHMLAGLREEPQEASADAV
jgi:uncharacterized protein Yka (UPF0111/DUF47 family)